MVSVAALSAAGAFAVLPIAQEAAAAPIPVTVTPNPAYQGPAFEGWGTSLVWFANATGDYPAEIRQELYDLLFGEDGLNLNVARYNIGGGNASDVPDYLRAGAAVEGWWAPDLDGTDGVTSNYADRAAYLANWDADDDASYNWDADATQRWWLQKLAAERDDTVFEAFSNSPPYFLTNSGYVTGGMSKTAKQLRTDQDAPQKFVTYLTKVVEHLEDQYGIDFKTVDPFNEPCNGYWGTPALGQNGWPQGGGTTQEGAQICPGTGAGDQQNVLRLLGNSLAASTTDAIISANDETNPAQFVSAWKSYDAAARDEVGQVNVHTYGTGGRLQARDIAKTTDKELWMSEVGGDFVGTGFNPTTITGGLGMAQRITDDLRELEPNAWVFWQEVEDYYNMEKVENLNWGSIFIDFDCNEDGRVGYSVRRLADAGWSEGDPMPDSAKCKIVTNSKFNTARNFTQFIRPGDHVVPTSNTQSTAAVTADGTGATIVHINDSAATRAITLDLSKFGAVSAGATVTPVTTTEVADAAHPELNALVHGAPVVIPAGATSITLEVPAKSVTTFVVDGISGVADDALPIEDGGSYQLVGVGSGRALTAGTTGLSITDVATTTADVSNQMWTFTALPSQEGSHALRYVLTLADGRVLGATSAGPDFRTLTIEEAAANPETWWTLNTTDGTTWSLVHGSTFSAIEVGSQNTANGSAVGIYGSGGGAHQRWTVRDTVITSVPDTALSTIAGVPPALPAAVVPHYSYGTGVAAPVVWDEVDPEVWDRAGSVIVVGHGTDVFGNAFEARAIVDVGGYTSTDPVSMTTYSGVALAAIASRAPATVPAQIGASSQRFNAVVQWDWSGVTNESFAQVGVVSIPGLAASNDPDAGPVPATLAVIVTAPGETNITQRLSSAVASSTENGYPISRTYNLSTTDKGWSNWVASNKPTRDTLTYTFAEAQDVTHVTTYFYKDGSTLSWPASMTVDYYDGSQWISVPDPAYVIDSSVDTSAPIVDIDLGNVRTTAIRLTLNARPNTHMIVSEVEIYGTAPSTATVSSLAALRADGVGVAGFSSDVDAYSMTVHGSRYPTISAVPTDSNASVTITQPSEATSGLARIDVTAADGVTHHAYTVDVSRRVAIGTAAIGGEAKVGSVATAAVVTDPADATLAYSWTISGSGDPVSIGSSYRPVADDAGKTLTLTVSATKAGFLGSDAVLAPTATVLEEEVEPTPEPTTEPTVEPTTEPTAEPTTEPTIDPTTDPTTDPTGGPTTSSPSSGLTVDLSATNITAGGTVTVLVTGAKAQSQVEIWLHSTPVKLATASAGADGTLSYSVTIPASTEAGTHRIRVVEVSSGGESWSAPFTVTAASPSAIPSTGVEPGTLIALATAFLCGAIVLVAIKRRGEPQR